MVFNGLDTGIFCGMEKSALRSERGIAQNQKVVLHVTPEFSMAPGHLKGGEYVIRLAEKMPDVQFVVAGPYTLEGTVPENVRFLGRISDQRELAAWYALADVTLLCSMRETFSMVCAESLCCGTPVAGFEAGAPEKISLPAYSEFVPYGDVEKLQSAVAICLAGKGDAQTISAAGCSAYDQEQMVDAYMACYRALLDEKGANGC